MGDHRFRISGFADEISADLGEQLDVVESLGLQHIDFRGVENTNVLDLTDDHIDRIQAQLDRRGISVTSIGSPIGKRGIEDPFDPHFDRFETALTRAKQFDTEYVRVFSYYIPDESEPAEHREEVIRRTERKVERAAQEGITLLHENEKGIYGDTPARCRDLLTTIDSPYYRAVFDPANFLEIGVRPHPDALLQIIEFVEQLHIKDATFGQRGEIVPAGEGDGEIAQTLAAFKNRGFQGTASLEPHLKIAGAKGGYSGSEAYEIAATALFDCLDAVDANYE